MTPKTTFRIESGEALGWVAQLVPDVDGSATTFLGAGKNPDEAVEHARARQARGDAPACAHAVVRPLDAARPIRYALDHLDAEKRHTKAAAARGDDARLADRPTPGAP